MAYLFDPQHLQNIVQKSVGLPLEENLDAITKALDAAYPGFIHTGPREWILNSAGGARGQLAVLHASLTEYLIFFGTPIGTHGHSGRYNTDLFDIMIEGEMWTFIEGENHKTVHVPGEMALLGPGLAKNYTLPSGGYMLEYGRGFIPSMLPFGLADSFFSTLDISSVRRTLVAYTKQFANSARRGKW